MVKVPEYIGSERLRPRERQGIDVQATPDAFGAAIGTGMAGLARGGMNLVDTIQAVDDLDATLKAKDAQNKLSDWDREAKYGPNGYLTKEGRNAVEARGAYEKQLADKQRELGAGLPPAAQRKFSEAAGAHARQSLQQAIIHQQSERKKWFNQAGSDRLSSIANDAVSGYGDAGLVDKSIGAGVAEIREQGRMNGWDAATLKQREADFTSSIRKNVVLRMAQDDPLAANSYMEKHKSELSGKDQYDLRGKLDSEVVSEKGKREADRIISSARTVGGAPGPASAGEGGGGARMPVSGFGTRTVAQGGPTKVRAALIARAGGAAAKVDNLDETFATNLLAMMDDAPEGIREKLGIYSGFRSVERQAEIFRDAVAKHGSVAAARRWAAPPGHSQHNHGAAVDLSYDGRSLRHAPPEVKAWVHGNARKYGLHFPMGHEPWHVEPIGTRGTGGGGGGGEGTGSGGAIVSRGTGVSARAMLPSVSDIEANLQGITDTKVRDAARSRVYSLLEAQTKAQVQREKAAASELWAAIDAGKTPDQVPASLRQEAGMAAVSSAWSYVQARDARGDVKSDETLLYGMRRYQATDPTGFADIDLNDYRDRLSKEAIKELTGLQTGALTKQREAKEAGLSLTSAFSQATQQLEAVGITATGKKGSAETQAQARIAQFQNALADEMEAFKRNNANKLPTQMDVQSMINKLLLPVVIKTPGALWGTNTDDTKRLFEAAYRAEGATVEVTAKITDIPVDLRRGIATDLARELGRKPSEKEVIERYKTFVTTR